MLRSRFCQVMDEEGHKTSRWCLTAFLDDDPALCEVRFVNSNSWKVGFINAQSIDK